MEGEGTYKHGEKVNLQAEPNEGFEFISWKKYGEEVKEKSFEFEEDKTTSLNSIRFWYLIKT
ncbi:InlB B-repeat-containing protein [Natranaerobius trueperi]|uniref:InlB B-repeat-containing protein n=1 Tax=Natranaerobius trueperi TaxID=759412 RepID=UPI003B836774